MENLQKRYDEAKIVSNDLPAGGYVLKIMHADNVPNKNYLRLELDIATGDHRGYYTQLFDRARFWGLTSYRSYTEKNMGWFKSFMELLESENEGFKWEWDETKLIGLEFGGVLGLEEYLANDGTVKASLKLKKTYTKAEIESGNFVVPPIKKLKQSAPVTGVVDNSAKPDDFKAIDEDVPF